MRCIRFLALAATLAALAGPVAAETKIFLIDSTDGYGIDRCLATGDRCGLAAATALCRANAFAKAVDFGRVDQNEITGALPGGIPLQRCEGPACPTKVAITCSR
jgi:hypothetical protein